MLKPLNKTLLLKLKEYQKNKNDFVDVQEVKEQNLILGEIIEVSNGSDFKIGQEIVFGRYATDLFQFEGEKYYFLREEDVIALKQ